MEFGEIVFDSYRFEKSLHKFQQFFAGGKLTLCRVWKQGRLLEEEVETFLKRLALVLHLLFLLQSDKLLFIAATAWLSRFLPESFSCL